MNHEKSLLEKNTIGHAPDIDKAYNYFFDRVDDYLNKIYSACGCETITNPSSREHYRPHSDQDFPLIIKKPSEEIIKKYSTQNKKVDLASSFMKGVVIDLFSKIAPSEVALNYMWGYPSFWEEETGEACEIITLSFTQRGFQTLLTAANALEEEKRKVENVSEMSSSFFYNRHDTQIYSPQISELNKPDYLSYLTEDEKKEVSRCNT